MPDGSGGIVIYIVVGFIGLLSLAACYQMWVCRRRTRLQLEAQQREEAEAEARRAASSAVNVNNTTATNTAVAGGTAGIISISAAAVTDATHVAAAVRPDDDSSITVHSPLVSTAPISSNDHENQTLPLSSIVVTASAT